VERAEKEKWKKELLTSAAGMGRQLPYRVEFVSCQRRAFTALGAWEGMSIVLIPDFSGELAVSFIGDVSVILFQAIDPDDEIVAFSFWQRQDVVFQFNQAH
jgi:hypothetical protein